MSASTKLSTSVKALCYLAKVYPEPKTSSDIAKRIGVNASKLRKILSMLVKNNIVESSQGASGGFILRKGVNELHLQEIYCAIEDRKAFHFNVAKSKGGYLSDTSKLNNFFLDLFADIQVEIEEKMRKLTLKSVLEKIEK